MFILKQTETTVHKQMSVLCVCGKETKFGGLVCPIICEHCDELLPDALDLHYSADERKSYHQDKEIFP